jgi:putative membrane protein
METIVERREIKSKLLINIISIAVPVTVMGMLAFPNKLNLGEWTKQIPHIVGAINTLTTLALIAGLFFIKNNKIDLHRISMIIAFALGGIFLVCYVLYHISNPANRFSGAGFIRYVYFFFLASHILLSLVVLPFVLRAMFYGVTRQFALHKRIVRYAYPIWLYVSISGVIIYLLLYQLFPSK